MSTNGKIPMLLLALTTALSVETTKALQQIPREEIPAAIAFLLERVVEPEPERPDTQKADDGGCLLSADEVAQALDVDRRWVYRHAQHLGAIRLSRRCLRFRWSGVDDYIKRRRAASSNGRRK